MPAACSSASADGSSASPRPAGSRPSGCGNIRRHLGVDEAEAHPRITTRVPIGHHVEPNEVAAMVHYVISPGAAAITAHALKVCGGLGNY